MGRARQSPPRRPQSSGLLCTSRTLTDTRNMVMAYNNSMITENNRNDSTSGIYITNFQNREIVNHSIVILKGVLTKGPTKKPEKLLCTLQRSDGLVKSYWNVHKGEFKVLIELCKGKNNIQLNYDQLNSTSLQLEYLPRNTNLRVTPLYIICQGHDGLFQSPLGEDNSIKSACSRIALGAKLIQSVTAEKLLESGFGRKTFQLEHEVSDHQPECLVFRSTLNVNRARKMKQSELWAHFGRELMLSDLGSNERKYLAFISCTRYKGTDVEKSLSHEEIVSMTEGYAALGGGGLALFGTACLYTWPEKLQDVIPKLTDLTPVNWRRFMDDSGYRGTLGGCFATTLGSVFHELGHTFDLGHTKDGIMGRGFDNIDRVFTVEEKKSQTSRDSMNNYSGKPNQHSTVSLQRNINVTMNVAEPMRVLGPRSKTTLGNFVSMTKSDIIRRNLNVTPINRPSSVYGSLPDKNQEARKNNNKENNNDNIYWTRNCAVFLSYHRWFNNEYGRERQAITKYLKFDKNKMMIISTAGLRIVEVRDEESGLVIDSYEFTNTSPEKRFLLPFTISPKSKVLTIVVEDDLGNVLKQAFSY